jgi:hypothetical protein
VQISPSPPQSKPPAPPPSPEQLEMKRKQALLAKVRTLREKLHTNIGDVEGKDPAKHYVWVNINDNRQITFQSLGYEVCRDPNIKSPWKKSDGTYVRGDLILYQIDKDLHEALELDSQLRALESVDGASEGFKAVAEREGVPVYEPGKRS